MAQMCHGRAKVRERARRQTSTLNTSNQTIHAFGSLVLNDEREASNRTHARSNKSKHLSLADCLYGTSRQTQCSASRGTAQSSLLHTERGTQKHRSEIGKVYIQNNQTQAM